VAQEYNLFSKSFFESLSPQDRFLLDIYCLNEHNSREIERTKEAEKEREMQKQMPGVTRMVGTKERSAQLRAMRAR
ncbi:MAG TPA: hypothetical protein PKM25_19370, partial [Candidatus Ozemobacteraceae bacterium]|nr:hypothetical protein [Candidatus Ozemobacteraceae bacterium]